MHSMLYRELVYRISVTYLYAAVATTSHNKPTYLFPAAAGMGQFLSMRTMCVFLRRQTPFNQHNQNLHVERYFSADPLLRNMRKFQCQMAR